MRSKKPFILATMSTFLLASLCSGCPKIGNKASVEDDDNASVEWYIDTVDSEGDAGKYPSIAIDSRGNVHICYYQFGVVSNYDNSKQPSYIMKYARKDEAGWQIFDLDFLEVHGEDSGIAVDSKDNVHISYCGAGYSDKDGFYDAVFHATNAAGDWQIELVENLIGLDYDTSIAIDSKDKVHMAYHANSALHYATNKSGSWEIFVIDSTNEDVGGHPSIVIDSNDNVHISYWSSSDRDLKYATNASGEWKIFVIDSGEDSGKYNDLAIDSKGNLHISYFERYKKHLNYATNASGSWKIYTIDTSEGVGLYTSIAIDSNDFVHISYCDGRNQALKYATNKFDKWQTFTIDKTASTGFYTSIAIDSDDYVHISYFNNSTDDPMYATNRPPK